MWRGELVMCFANSSSLPYFDYGFTEGFRFTGGADPAERYDIIPVGELAGRDAHDQNVSIPGSLRAESFYGEHFFSVRSE